MTSCFTVFAFVPRASPADGLAPARAQRGYAFRLGSASDAARDESVTHWRAGARVVPRVLLLMHSRGGLELPGGHREAGETLPGAAAREFAEEAGAQLPQPALSYADATLVRTVGGGGNSAAGEDTPRWVVFFRATESEAEFDAAVAACAASRRPHGYPVESWGAVGAPLFMEGSSRGAPRALAAMPPWQCELLLPTLVLAGVLTAEEAAELARAADVFVAAGGLRGRAKGDVPRTIAGALEDALGGDVGVRAAAG